GTEFSLTLNPTKLVSLGGLDWVFRTNYYTTSSEVTKLNVDPYNYGGFATFLGTYRIQEGWSPTAIVGSEMDGDKYIELGNETPDYTVSFFNGLRVGPVSFSFLIDHKEGGHAINLANLIYDLGGTTGDYDKEELDLDGDGTKSGNGNERLTVLGGVTAPYIESTAYTMLREVNLTISLPSTLSDALNLGYLQIGVAGRNLWMDTSYTGLSPEVSQFGNVPVGGSVDTNPYPQSKSTYFTLSAGF
ncbi:MAG: SusC/RagA family TonB-linked outer membrane protein, partial [Candidatus Marinimicrobia bacterium]|nr:SusC/RagA family TonB-linked outer membrane protein [Candidatus Neomarinimicrobiota bacterium]